MPTTAPSSPSEKGDGAEPRLFSSIRRSSLPIPPPLFTTRSSFNPFAAPSPSDRRSGGAWIDADALHGPKVKKARESKRYSIRVSWPLRAMAPTLPKLSAASSSSTALSTTYESHHDLFLAGRGDDFLFVSRGVLKMPRPVLTSRGAGPNLSPTKKSGGSVAGLRSAPPGTRTRNVSTDSTLSQILRSTEQRLQEGGATGVARRNRLSASPTKPGTPTREAAPGTMSNPIDGSTLYQGEEGGSRTPSPSKMSPDQQGGPADHTRHSSVGSEADSLLDGASSMGELPTALSSPSRAASCSVKIMSESPTSSVSSALSTVYSEDETQEGTTQFTSVHSSSILEGSKMQTPTGSDPFVSSTPARPGRDWPVNPECRNLAELNRPLRLRGRSHSPGEALALGLSYTSSNEQLLSPPSDHFSKQQQQQYPHQHQGRPLPSPRLPETPEGSKNRATTTAAPGWLREGPSVFVTSPSSIASVSSTPQSLPVLTYHGIQPHVLDSPTQRRAYPPPLSLPTMDREPSLILGDEESMPPLPGSPEMSLVGPQSRDSLISSSSAEDNSPMLHEMPGTMRNVSTDSSNYSGRPAAESGSPPMRLNSVSIQVSKLPTLPRDAVTSGNHRPLRLASTIAELRPMSSQISAYSDASSAYSGAAGTSRLPVRTGGTSTRHYLTLGNSNANGARDRGRPALGMRASILVEEEMGCGEKENEGGETKRARVDKDQDKKRRNEQTPPKNKVDPGSPRKGAPSPDRMSQESLGVYDGDGFLISSPLRA